MNKALTEENRERFRHVSTATVTTALFKRGFRNLFLQDVHRVAPGPNMVGEAYTMRYIPAREDLDVLDVFRDRTHPQRKGIEECPAGHVFVCDSRGDPSAASAGNILATRLQVRGVAGLVTDGGFRDTPVIAKLDMPSYHKRPAAPTNLIRHHAVDLQVPIACGGVPVFPGDILIGDNEGVAVVPAAIANEIAEEAHQMTAFEDFVEAEVFAGRSTFGLYPPTDDDTLVRFEAWRNETGR